jgi:hypothetical protein
MNSRERVKAALNHKTTDVVPMDFGAIGTTGIHVSCVDELRRHYGIWKGPVRVPHIDTMLGEIEDDLADIMGIDTTGIWLKNNTFGIPNENWKEWINLQGLKILVAEKFNPTNDGSGGLYMYPEGDQSVAPSGHMPAGGLYFDAMIRQSHFDPENLNVEDNVEEFKLLSQTDLDYLKERCTDSIRKNKCVAFSIPGTALGDVSRVPGMELKDPKGIRDIEEWYMAPMLYPEYVKQIYEKQVEIGIENLRAVNKAVGDMIDVVFLCGTDFGSQNNTLCSKDTFKEFYLPYYKQMNGWIHQNTGWKTFKHSCGAIEPFIPLLIESGFDILNPVQISAVGMDSVHLKKEYGAEITFWGGGVDTQKTLPFGTAQEVREQVLRQCEIFAKDGGFVFNSVHCIQAGTPVENIVAMVDAVHEFSGR